MKVLQSSCFVAMCSVALLFPQIGNAEVKEIPETELTMNRGLSKDIHHTLYYLKYGHYSPKTLNDDYSSKILDAYLKILDPSKLYFTQADIDTFETYRTKIDDLLLQRDAEVAFEIFKLFRKRVSERNALIHKYINTDFDFNLNEDFNLDRDSYRWATTKAEITEKWRQRIKNDTLQQLMGKTEIDEVRKNLRRRYDRQRDVIFQLKAEEVFEWFMNAFTQEHGPHTTYMSHTTAENFDISMSLSLQGIGAALNSEDDYTVISRIITGGPAEKSNKLKAEDKIVAVGQDGEEMVDVVGWRLMDVVQLIRGDKGTKVKLDFVSGDAVPGTPSERIELVRDIIHLDDQAAKLTYVEVPTNSSKAKYGVISIPSFYSNAPHVGLGGDKYVATTHDVQKLIKEAEKEGVQGLVLDLRGNGGGYLNEAVSLTGLFIDQGPVVQIVGSRPNQRKVEKDLNRGVAYDGPLVVMIDRFSASASEIFAGAIQDYGRGLIVGERSFGKGTVQNPASLSRDNKRKSKIKYTNAQFFRVNGSSTQYKGVVPDLILNSGQEDNEFGERSYDNALPWSSTRAATYRTNSFPVGMLEVLNSKHLQRSAQSPAFEYLRQASARSLANKDIKSISLNQKRRQDDQDQREKAVLTDLNAYRKSLGLDPVTMETRKDNPLPGEDEHWNSVFHEEAARILHDFNTHSSAVITKVADASELKEQAKQN